MERDSNMRSPGSTLGSAQMAFIEGVKDRRGLSGNEFSWGKNKTSPKLRDRAKRVAVNERLAREAEAAEWIEQVKRRKP